MPFFAVILLAACTSSGPHSAFIAVVHVQPRQYYFVDDAAPSRAALQRAVDFAIAGDDAKLAYVTSLVRYTDGEGAENFGALLNQLRGGVTSFRFQRALSSLPPDIRQSAVACMQVAEKLHVAASSVKT